MNVFQIRCAGIVAEFHGASIFSKELYGKYLTEGQDPDITVRVLTRHIEAVRKGLGDVSAQELEFSACYCALSEELLKLRRCAFHAAVVAVDGRGYAFAAKSGVGKTTQAMLWKKHFGERCVIVNGDKPFLTLGDNVVYASGTPWCGKEGLSENITVPLDGICFLERSAQCSIKRLSSSEIIDRLFYSLNMPARESGRLLDCLQFADLLINKVPFYLLRCNMTDESVITAYEEMKK